MFTFLPVNFDEQSMAQYNSLFNICFSNLPKFEKSALRWLYVDNPDGHAVGFNAFNGDELAAHYVCIPSQIRVNGVIQKALLSLNTATHPRYQGKGLFTKLAELTYSAGSNMGYGSVYGVANANSTPGFTRKLGFQLVQPLSAKVGVGRLGVNFSVALNNSQFERIWTPELLKWRCNNPSNLISYHAGKGYSGYQAKALGYMLQVYAELPENINANMENAFRIPPFRLFLGLMPEQSCNFLSYFDIPNRLRPSPLNLIYRSLSKVPTRLEPGLISFSFLDFDAY